MENNENYEELNELADELSQLFSDNHYVSVYVHRLYDDEVSQNQSVTEKIIGNVIQLEKKLKKSGLLAPYDLPVLHTIRCMADADASVVIDPKGALFKCEHIDDLESHGSLFSDITDDSALKLWEETFELRLCSECPLFPKCILLSHCESSRDCTKELMEWNIEQSKWKMLDTYSRWKSGVSSQ